jgi:putative inorganic carbon (HCO3(-)) transporter
MVVALVDILFVCIVLAAFVFGLRAGVATLIVIRPLTDRLFQLAAINVAGHAVTYGVTLNLIVICATILNIFRIRRCTPSGLQYMWLPFLLVCAVAVLYSPLQIDASRRLLIYVCYYSIFVLSFVIVRSERDVLFFLKLVILSSVLPVLYGLFQTLSGVDWFGDSRIQSTFSHPNMFAFYLLAVIGVILFLNTTGRIRISGRLRLLLNLYLIPLLIVLIMTKTRSAWIGCMVLFFVYGLAHDRRLLVLMLIATPLAFAIPAVHERIVDLMSENNYIGGPAVELNSYAWRKLLWENAFTYIWRQPIFGYGLHSFPFYSAEFFYPTPDGTYAHNDYIQVLFETGLVGLITFLWIFWRCFVWLFQRWRFDKRGVTAAAAIMVAYMICSYSDNLLEYLPYQWEFWFPFGVICWHIGQHQTRAGSLGYRSYRSRFGSWARLTRTRGLPAVGAPTRAAGPEI